METKISQDRPYLIQLKEGSQEAFDFLFRKYSKKIYYFAIRYLFSKEDAEGLVQDIFLKVWSSRATLKPDESFNSYLFTIAKNTIFNLNRKKINEQAYLDFLEIHIKRQDDFTEHQVLYNELTEVLDNSINELPEKRKQVFLLSREKNLSHKEIALHLNISVKTVENHLGLALKQIREKVDIYQVLLLLFYALSK